MTRAVKVLLVTLMVIACGLALKFAVPATANLFAGFGVDIPLPAALVSRHPWLVIAYLGLLALIPFAVLAAAIWLFRYCRRSRPKQQS